MNARTSSAIAGLFRSKWPAGCALLGAGLLLAGCVSLEQAAPPVGTSFPVGGGNLTQLSAGRDLYVTRCAKCHRTYPVRDFSAAKWEEIHAEMAEEAKLSPIEDSAVRAYVRAVLNLPATR